MLSKLKEYFATTPREKVEADWTAVKELLRRYGELLNPFISDFLLALKLWALTVVFPIAATVMLCLGLILGAELKRNPLSLWSDFYYSGYLLNIEAYRWHGAVFFMCLLYCATREKQ